MQGLRAAWDLLKKTLSSWSDDNAERLSAALAYYAIFSAGPLLLIAVVIAGFFFGHDAAEGKLYGQLQGVLGNEGAQAVQTLVKAAYRPTGGRVATVIAALTLIIGATGVIINLRDALNVVWSVRPKAGLHLKLFLRKYAIALATLLATGVLLIASIVVSSATTVAQDYASQWLPIPALAIQAINFVSTFVLLTLAFAFLFKFLPDVKIRFREVLIGGALTALLFTIGKVLIGIYIGRQGVTSAYGAAGSIIAFLLWIYYSALIFFIGAEFTKVYGRRNGRTVEPDEFAERIEKNLVHKPHAAGMQAHPTAASAIPREPPHPSPI